VKTLKKVDKENLTRFRCEIVLLAGLHHSNIVLLVGCCWERKLMALVMEFVENGTSSDVLKREGANDAFNWKSPMFKFSSDAARAMKYVHGVSYQDRVSGQVVHGIIHRDLKPDNCLVTEYYDVKIADFGEARQYVEEDADDMTKVGTPLYCAPEIIRGDSYDRSCDVFSFALTLVAWGLKDGHLGSYLYTCYEINDLMNSQPLSKKATTKDKLARVVFKMAVQGWRPDRGDLAKLEMPESLIELVVKCWSEEPKERPSFAEILETLDGRVKEEIFSGVSDSTGSKHSMSSRFAASLKILQWSGTGTKFLNNDGNFDSESLVFTPGGGENLSLVFPEGSEASF
jgi:serine/threonine protein kinase